MATTPTPPNTPATATFYCARCGIIVNYFQKLAEKSKPHPICPVDSNPMQPIDEAANDPALR